ncbi:MAG: hypothetical protein WC509_03710 [Candidatus Izemoplasmatales bacterium]
MRRVLSCLLLVLSIAFIGCRLTTDPYAHMLPGEALAARMADFAIGATDGYDVVVTRTIERFTADGELPVESTEFGLRSEGAGQAASAFVRMTRGDAVTAETFSMWRLHEGVPVFYRLVGSTVYADASETTPQEALAEDAWNFLPPAAWHDYGDVAFIGSGTTAMTSSLPIEALSDESAFAGYAAAFADELAHLSASGSSGIDLDFSFYREEWQGPDVIRIDIDFLFDLDPSYDGETTRLRASFRSDFVLDCDPLEYLRGRMAYHPLVASDPAYLLWRTEEGARIELDASVLSANHILFYFSAGTTHYATVKAGAPAFVGEFTDAEGTVIPVTDGAFTVVHEGLHVFRIVSCEDPNLTIRIAWAPDDQFS